MSNREELETLYARIEYLTAEKKRVEQHILQIHSTLDLLIKYLGLGAQEKKAEFKAMSARQVDRIDADGTVRPE